MAGEGVDVLEPDARVVGDQRLPARSGAVGATGAVPSSKSAPVRVVQHQEDVLAADHGVLEAVLERPRARAAKTTPAGVGVVGVEEAVLGGGLGAATRSPGTGRCGCGRRRPRTARRSRGGPARRRPGRCRAGAARPCRRARTRRRSCSRGRAPSRSQVAPPRTPAISSGSSSPVREVLDPDRVALVADDVGGVGQQGAVGADRRAAEREEVVALGERVEVEQHLLAGQRGLVGRAVLGRAAAGSSRPGRATGTRQLRAVLPALEGAAVVPVAAVAGRHRQVGLLGAGLDLLEDRAAAGRPGARCGPAVQAFSASRYAVTSGDVLVAQPLVVVDAGVGRGARWWSGRRSATGGCMRRGVRGGGTVRPASVGRVTRGRRTSTPTSARRSPTTRRCSRS